jgi:Ribonuclease G/E
VIAVSRQGTIARIALLEGDRLREYWLWDTAQPDGVGDLYSGRIAAVMPAMAGRFVDIGSSSGFLPDRAGGKGLSVGTYVAVRVTRSAQGGKGPRLEAVPVQSAGKPGLLKRGPGPLIELCERLPAEQVVLDDYALIAELRTTIEGRMRYDAKAFDPVLEDEVTGLSAPTAALPMGAKMHVTVAPAATLVDIDAQAASDVPPLALNSAIIPEICRQIVLRNLSGGILIDFAGMKANARTKLTEPLAQALAKDFLRPEFLGFSQLGFAEISRRRVRPPLHEVIGK